VRSGFNKLREADLTIKDLWSLRALSEKSTEWNLTKWSLELLGFALKVSKRTTSIRYYSLFDLVADERRILFDFWDVERLDFFESSDDKSHV